MIDEKLELDVELIAKSIRSTLKDFFEERNSDILDIYGTVSRDTVGGNIIIGVGDITKKAEFKRKFMSDGVVLYSKILSIVKRFNIPSISFKGRSFSLQLTIEFEV